MKIVTYTTVESFLADVSPLLSSSTDKQMENNLALGLTRRIGSGHFSGPCLLLAVKDEQGIPLMAAMMPQGYNLVLSGANDEAAAALASHLHQEQYAVDGVMAIDKTSDAFATAWRHTTGNATTLRLKMTFYVATHINSNSAPVQGVLRPAAPTDQEWLTEWIFRFAEDSNLNAYDRRRDPEGTAQKIRNGLIYVWEKDGVPVSIAGYGNLTDWGVRIGSVYTPPAERRKGYATACAAALSQRIINEGKWCSLFADMANPVSNAMYVKMGYRAHCIYHEYKFES